ncbi:MAG: hypothetical protein M3R66_02125 [Actinomycetota bacterium]|nr:hypothetical protein [Actinomycetota bacterium]
MEVNRALGGSPVARQSHIAGFPDELFHPDERFSTGLPGAARRDPLGTAAAASAGR